MRVTFLVGAGVRTDLSFMRATAWTPPPPPTRATAWTFCNGATRTRTNPGATFIHSCARAPTSCTPEPPPLAPCRDAAALASTCSAARAAFRESKWPRDRAVRVKRDGTVLEPASGAFDVVVAPGEGVQAAVDACPPGGCVLLLPGSHKGPLFLFPGKVVHVFGRGRATLRTASGTVVISAADKSTMDGIAVRREAGGDVSDSGMWIRGGQLHLQACDVTSASPFGACVAIEEGADPVLINCKCVPGATGVSVT